MWCLNALATRLAFRVVSLPPRKAVCLWRQDLAVKKWPSNYFRKEAKPDTLKVLSEEYVHNSTSRGEPTGRKNNIADKRQRLLDLQYPHCKEPRRAWCDLSLGYGTPERGGVGK